LPMRSQSPSSLIVAASENDANMLYATAFFAPDPFSFFSQRGRKYLVMSDLEIDRAKLQADVDTVLSLSHYAAKLKNAGQAAPATADILELLFKEKRIDRVAVPANFPTLLADELRKRAIALDVKRDPFFPLREKKRDDEAAKI